MATHNATGHLGEQMAADYFTQLGYIIIEKNWRHSHWEVDLIASKDSTLHFIEVKTRRTKNFGLPEENVTKKKIQYLINASAEYLHLHPEWKRIQFNVLAISMIKNEQVEYFLIEDIYL
jgi:putative endonuclease